MMVTIMTTGITKTLDDQNKKPTANEKSASFAWGGEGDRSDPDRIQTCDLLLRRQLLYSTELPDLKDGAQDKLKFKVRQTFQGIKRTSTLSIIEFVTSVACAKAIPVVYKRGTQRLEIACRSGLSEIHFEYRIIF